MKYISSYNSFFKDLLFIFTGKADFQKEGDICWFTPKMVKMAGAEPI